MNTHTYRDEYSEQSVEKVNAFVEKYLASADTLTSETADAFKAGLIADLNTLKNDHTAIHTDVR